MDTNRSNADLLPHYNSSVCVNVTKFLQNARTEFDVFFFCVSSAGFRNGLDYKLDPMALSSISGN